MSSELGVSGIGSLQRFCSPARSFARQGPLERVPPRHSSYCALRPLGARPARFPLPFRSCPDDRSAETPSQVPGRPLRTCPVLRSRRGMRLKPRRSALPVAHRRILSPSTVREVSAPASESISGPNHAACTLAVYASRSRSPVYLLTISQDSLPAWRFPSSPVGFSPRVVHRNFGLLHAFLSGQACPGAPATVTTIGGSCSAHTSRRPAHASVVLRRARLRHPSAQQPPASSRV